MSRIGMSSERLRPDLVALDVSMPVMGSSQAARLPREHGPYIRIVFATQHQDPSYAEQASRLGAQGYVLKRLIPSELTKQLCRNFLLRRSCRGSCPWLRGVGRPERSTGRPQCGRRLPPGPPAAVFSSGASVRYPPGLTAPGQTLCPPQGSRYPLDGSMLLLHNLLQRWHRTADHGGPVRCIGALARGCMGRPWRRLAIVRNRSAASLSRCSVS